MQAQCGETRRLFDASSNRASTRTPLRKVLSGGDSCNALEVTGEMALVCKPDVTRDIYKRSPFAQEPLRRFDPNLCQIGMRRETHVSPKGSHQMKAAEMCDFGQIFNTDVLPVVAMEVVFDADDPVPLVPDRRIIFRLMYVPFAQTSKHFSQIILDIESICVSLQFAMQP